MSGSTLLKLGSDLELVVGKYQPYAYNSNQKEGGAENMPFNPLKDKRLDYHTIKQSSMQNDEDHDGT